MAMRRLADRTSRLTLLFGAMVTPVRRVRRMVLHRYNDITLQNDSVSVPRFMGTVIHATNLHRHLLLSNRQYNKPYMLNVRTF